MDFLRRDINRLRRASGASASFRIKSGAEHRFSPKEALQAVYLHGSMCARSDYHRRPRPKRYPEILVKISEAEDRNYGVRLLFPDDVLLGTYDQGGPFCGADLAHLVETGELRPRLMAPSYPPIEAA